MKYRHCEQRQQKREDENIHDDVQFFFLDYYYLHTLKSEKMTMKFSKKNGEDNETLQHTTHVDKLDVAIDYTYPQRKNILLFCERIRIEIRK